MDTSTHSGDAGYEWVIGLNRAVLSLLGLWPETYKTARRKLNMNIRVIIIILLLSSSIAPIIHSLIKVWGDITSMMNNLWFILPLLITKIKIITMWRKRKVLISLLKMIKEDWIKVKTEEEKTVMIKQARMTRLIIILGYLVVIVSVSFYVIFPNFETSMRYANSNNTDRIHLLPGYYVYTVSRSPFYEMTLMQQSLSLAATAIVYTATDTFMGLLIFHTCGQLENLKAHILDLNKLNNFQNTLSSTVQEHMRLIRFIRMVDNTFTSLLFIILVYFGIMFALYGFLFITILTQGRNMPVNQLIVNLLSFIAALAHVSLYCVLGEFLVTHCNGIYEAVYRSIWYNLEPKQAKNLLIILMQTNKPLYLTAGKLFPMTMVTLCSLIKTSAGYISVLLAYRN